MWPPFKEPAPVPNLHTTATGEESRGRTTATREETRGRIMAAGEENRDRTVHDKQHGGEASRDRSKTRTRAKDLVEEHLPAHLWRRKETFDCLGWLT